MFYVIRLFGFRRVETSVNTPTAIVGVRGTQFGVEVLPQAGLPPEGSGEAKTLAATQTRVFGFHGQVSVYSHAAGKTLAVGPGQDLRVDAAGLAPIQRTDPGDAQGFISDTALPQGAEEEGSQEPGGSSGKTPAPGTQPDEPEEGATDGEDQLTGTASLTTLVQDQVNIGIQQSAASLTVTSRPTRHWGYYSGMLTMDPGGSPQFSYLYLSEVVQDFDDMIAEAKDPLIGGRRIAVDATAYPDTVQLTEVELPFPELVVDLPKKINHTEIGFNPYQEWGYWKQPIDMLGSDGFIYRFDNRGYYVVGDHTTADQMSALHALNLKADYSGTAHGTFWTADGGRNMSGNFKASIDFGAATRQVTDFNLSVSGGGHWVKISGVEGAFTDPVYNPGHFVLPTTTKGTWEIDGVTGGAISDKRVFGAVYGAQGEAVGGVWKIDGSPDKHATGMFQGTR